MVLALKVNYLRAVGCQLSAIGQTVLPIAESRLLRGISPAYGKSMDCALARPTHFTHLYRCSKFLVVGFEHLSRFGHTRNQFLADSPVSSRRRVDLLCLSLFGLSENGLGNRCILSAVNRLTEVVAESNRIFGRGAGGQKEHLTARFRKRGDMSPARRIMRSAAFCRLCWPQVAQRGRPPQPQSD